MGTILTDNISFVIIIFNKKPELCSSIGTMDICNGCGVSASYKLFSKYGNTDIHRYTYDGNYFKKFG